MDTPAISALGGKGYNLVQLTRGGFRVPEGFIVKASAFDDYAASCSLIQKAEDCSGSIDDKCALINSIMDSTPVSDSLRSAIETVLNQLKMNPSLPSPLLAVRSSGVTEDLDEASFAGMNDTILNVPADVDSVCDAVKACWRSLYGKRSILYRQENGFSPYNTSIAVVVQVMVPSECSGVLFTADAQTGSRGEISLDGVQGLGEALVEWSGQHGSLDRSQAVRFASHACDGDTLRSSGVQAGIQLSETGNDTRGTQRGRSESSVIHSGAGDDGLQDGVWH